MNSSFLLIYIFASSTFLITGCQKAFDPNILNSTPQGNSLNEGSTLEYTYTNGTSATDTFTLTVTGKDTVINGKNYKVLNRSDGLPHNYLAKIDSDYYRYPPLVATGFKSFEELYLKDNLAVNSTWTASTRYFKTEASRGLIANWIMDEGRGTVLRDASDNNNNATIMDNPSWLTGVSGQALQFNGNQYATVPNNASLNITKAITLAAWIKPEKRATQYILKKAIIGSTDGYEISLSTDGLVFFRLNQASSGNTYRLNSTGSYPTDGSTWMHIAVTYDGSTIKIFLNGIENNAKTVETPVEINVNTLALAIGAQSDGTTKFRGAIDDARIYNTAT